MQKEKVIQDIKAAIENIGDGINNAILAGMISAKEQLIDAKIELEKILNNI